MRSLIPVLVFSLSLLACKGDDKPATAPAPEPERVVEKPAEKPAEKAPEAAKKPEKQPWNGGAGSFCEPGQVNNLGVGRPCTKNADCSGFKASMCQSAFKGPSRPSVCTVHCEKDEDCGADAMCGLSRGWLRSCYPKRCTDFVYDTNRLRPLDGVPPTHEGAVICDPGFTFYPEQGWGLECSTENNDACQGRMARVCSQLIYPPGVPRCWRECRTDAQCGENSYCGYTEVTTFTGCMQRCPTERLRGIKEQPQNLTRCKVNKSIVDTTANKQGIGRLCDHDDECKAEGNRCGRKLEGLKRQPNHCTKACKEDSECGTNALCLNLNEGTEDEPANYCVAACWAL
jgi:hypothetical protein